MSDYAPTDGHKILSKYRKEYLENIHSVWTWSCRHHEQQLEWWKMFIVPSELWRYHQRGITVIIRWVASNKYVLVNASDVIPIYIPLAIPLVYRPLKMTASRYILHLHFINIAGYKKNTHQGICFSAVFLFTYSLDFTELVGNSSSLCLPSA